MRKKVNKKLRKFLGLWWIEPIEDTLKEMGKKPYKWVPPQPFRKLRPGNFKPTITKIS
jgi:hypothetical protein